MEARRRSRGRDPPAAAPPKNGNADVEDDTAHARQQGWGSGRLLNWVSWKGGADY